MKRVHQATVLACALFAASLSNAVAALQLRISNGNPADTVNVVDQGPGDNNALVGFITYNGPVGAQWTTISSGVGTPAIGNPATPYMELHSVDVSSVGAGVLTIELTDTGFTGVGPAATSLGGISQGTASVQVYADGGNAPFGTASLITSGGPYAGVFGDNQGGLVNVSTPYSLTIVLVVTHSGPDRNRTAIDIDFSVTPDTGCPACINPNLGLGAAAGETVLQLGSGKVSITGPAGGIIGDVAIGPKGSLSMSGDEYVTGTIKLATGAKFSNSSHGIVNVQQNVNLSAEIAAAYAANLNAASLPCSQTFAKLDGKVTTILGAVGVNVICVGDISLSGKQIALTGPVGTQFIINVKGKFSLTGGGAGPQIRATGGVQPKDVLYNLVGPGADVAFSGGGGGVDCCAAVVDGTLLAPYRKINLSPGLVNGQIISGLDINIVSGSSVRCPPCP